MILSKASSKDSTKKLLQTINKFTKVAEYKINIEKSIAFLYTYNETSEKEVNDPIHNGTKNNIIPRNKFN